MTETASVRSPLEWTVAGALDEIESIDKRMPDRSIAFLLGSGASASSGVSSGKIMAENWELHIRECHDGSDRNAWIASDALGIKGLAWDRAAEFYPLIFECRFRGDPESGFAALEAAMDGKEPSLGYSLLAEIMQQTRHKVVVTTNFDNLVADALAIHAHKPPLIVGHESLTGYVRAALRRPLVAKIHRDLFLHPKNDVVGVGALEKGWIDALTRLFKHYMPLVIGYGGNDGSLMGFLNSLNPEDIVGRIIWCYQTESYPSAAIQKLLAEHHGVIVAIPSFDEFMLHLAAKLIPNFNMARISSRIEELGKKRAANYRKQAENLQKSIMSIPAPSIDQEVRRQVLADAFKDQNDWWTWEMRARAEPDAEGRNYIYTEGLKALPSDPELMNNYALFLADEFGDLDAAEVLHKRVIELVSRDSESLSNYAFFLAHHRKNFNAAELMYKRAIEASSEDSYILGIYADFLASDRKDFDAAAAMYKRALEVSPMNINNLSNYAGLLFAKGQVDLARPVLDDALQLLNERPPSAINAECWMYAYCCVHPKYKIALTELKHLVSEFSIRTDEWDFSGVIAQAVHANHPEAEWLPRLADVLVDRASVETLDGWLAWNAA